MFEEVKRYGFELFVGWGEEMRCYFEVNLTYILLWASPMNFLFVWIYPLFRRKGKSRGSSMEKQFHSFSPSLWMVEFSDLTKWRDTAGLRLEDFAVISNDLKRCFALMLLSFLAFLCLD